MPGKVVDASLLAAYAFKEDRFEEAQVLLRDADLYAPTLLSYELTNTACKKARIYPTLSESLTTGLDMALALDIQLVQVPHQPVLFLALETGLSAYDASYLYLARSLAIPLLTFDTQLAAAAALRT